MKAFYCYFRKMVVSAKLLAGYILLTFSLVFLTFSGAAAQSKYEYEFENVMLDTAIQVVEKENDIRLFYISEWTENSRIDGHFRANSLKELLDKMLYHVGLSCVDYDGSSFILIRELSDGQIIEEYTSTGEKINKVIVGDPSSEAREAVIKGRIMDLDDESPLAGATVYSKQSDKGVASGLDGYYELTLPTGEHTLEINSLGYHPETQTVILQSSGSIDISLVSSKITLDVVTVEGFKESPDISEAQMSKESFQVENLAYVPSLMGEKDIVKTINLLPGVISSEASSGYSVRGGGYGQNLVFLESTPLYNTSHLFGLFSVFNPGVAESVSIYKGTMPPRYGGRVSSVMDIHLKDGDQENWQGEAAFGLLSSRASLELPITEKLSLVTGGRVSYFNRMLERTFYDEVQNSRGSFYDTNLKMTYKLTDSTTLSVNAFSSYDDFTLPEGEEITYGNQLASGSWEQIFSEHLHGKFDLTFSNYYSTINSEDSLVQRFVRNGITTSTAKGYFSFFKFENHTLNSGFEVNRVEVDPGKVERTDPLESTEIQIPIEKGIESAIFLGDEFKLSDKITLNLGLRYSHFMLLGPGEQYVYEANSAKRTSTITDTLTYGNGDLMQTYGGLEPRFFFKYDLDPSLALKFNMGRTRQFLHLMSNTASISPLNIWKLSSSNLQPQVSDQMAIGMTKTIRKHAIEISYEFFYRHTNNLPDFKNGAVLYDNENIETEIISGIGQAYGHEFQLAKKTGKLSGWLAYTYSRSFNTMDSDIAEEKVNNGEKYPSNYDIPHSVSLSGDYLLSRLWSVSFNWVYNTGRPITYPVASYFHDGISIANYSDRNAYRIPDYHRLDLAVNLKGSNLKIDKKWDYTLSLSAYNVYNRKNAYSVFFQRVASRIEGRKLSILGETVPSVTLTIKKK
jgi:hypothetical protein